MAKRVRTVARGSGSVEPTVSSRALIPKPSDPQQPELFGPVFIPPCKPKLSRKVPAGDLWRYEIKHDCPRAQGQERCHTLRAKLLRRTGRKAR